MQIELGTELRRWNC